MMMTAAEIAHALKGKRSGYGWTARCPAHKDSDPSLSIGQGDDGRILVHCFAGCPQDAVIDALRARGLWANGDASRDRLITPERFRAANEQRERENAERAATVLSIWNEARDPRGTVAEEYLAARKLHLPPELRVRVLRFHPACPWESGTVPCLVAAFRAIADDALTGVHRIRLDQPERWPKAERKMLGTVAGSAVKLDAAGDRLAIGEGVETCMAARQLGLRPTWALGSATGIKHFPMIDGVGELTILGENDNGTNRNAAEECRENWKQRRVILRMPRRGFKDFNDMLMEQTNALSA
jgi:putative DNA primase/helicase